MNLFERLYVATMAAIDAWFSVVSPAPKVDLEDRLRYGELGEDYDPPNSLEGP